MKKQKNQVKLTSLLLLTLIGFSVLAVILTIEITIVSGRVPPGEECNPLPQEGYPYPSYCEVGYLCIGALACGIERTCRSSSVPRCRIHSDCAEGETCSDGTMIYSPFDYREFHFAGGYCFQCPSCILGDTTCGQDYPSRVECINYHFFSSNCPAIQYVCVKFVDNDGDGYFSFRSIELIPPTPEYVCNMVLDCDDTNPDVGICDCTPTPDPTEICDGIDNDCDGEIDEGFEPDNCRWTCTSQGYTWLQNNAGSLKCCGDDSAEDNPFQLTETSCSDRNDNDCDGKTDCQDSDCVTSQEAIQEICDDSVDNNCNGKIDCDDTDCGDDEACQGAISLFAQRNLNEDPEQDKKTIQLSEDPVKIDESSDQSEQALYLNPQDTLGCKFETTEQVSQLQVQKILIKQGTNTLISDDTQPILPCVVEGTNNICKYTFSPEDTALLFDSLVNKRQIKCEIKKQDDSILTSHETYLIERNLKDEEMYERNPVFLTSDLFNPDTSPASIKVNPIAIWEDSWNATEWCNHAKKVVDQEIQDKEEICAYPFLVFHNEKNYPQDSISEFISKYETQYQEQQGAVTGIAIKNKQESSSQIKGILRSAGVDLTAVYAQDSLQTFWQEKGIIILTKENSYKENLLASQLAAYYNAPILYDTDELKGLLIPPNNNPKLVIIIGDINPEILDKVKQNNLILDYEEQSKKLRYTTESASFSGNSEQRVNKLQQFIIYLKSPTSAIITNPNDILPEYCEADLDFDQLYCKLSLSTPFLATATNSLPFFVETSQSSPGKTAITQIQDQLRELNSLAKIRLLTQEEENLRQGLAGSLQEASIIISRQAEDIQVQVNTLFSNLFDPELVYFLGAPTAIPVGREETETVVNEAGEQEQAYFVLDPYYLNFNENIEHSRLYSASISSISTNINWGLFYLLGDCACADGTCDSPFPRITGSAVSDIGGGYGILYHELPTPIPFLIEYINDNARRTGRWGLMDVSDLGSVEINEESEANPFNNREEDALTGAQKLENYYQNFEQGQGYNPTSLEIAPDISCIMKIGIAEEHRNPSTLKIDRIITRPSDPEQKTAVAYYYYVMNRFKTGMLASLENLNTLENLMDDSARPIGEVRNLLNTPKQDGGIKELTDFLPEIQTKTADIINDRDGQYRRREVSLDELTKETQDSLADLRLLRLERMLLLESKDPLIISPDYLANAKTVLINNYKAEVDLIFDALMETADTDQRSELVELREATKIEIEETLNRIYAFSYSPGNLERDYIDELLKENKESMDSILASYPWINSQDLKEYFIDCDERPELNNALLLTNHATCKVISDTATIKESFSSQLRRNREGLLRYIKEAGQAAICIHEVKYKYTSPDTWTAGVDLTAPEAYQRCKSDIDYALKNSPPFAKFPRLEVFTDNPYNIKNNFANSFLANIEDKKSLKDAYDNYDHEIQKFVMMSSLTIATAGAASVAAEASTSVGVAFSLISKGGAYATYGGLGLAVMASDAAWAIYGGFEAAQTCNQVIGALETPIGENTRARLNIGPNGISDYKKCVKAVAVSSLNLLPFAPALVRKLRGVGTQDVLESFIKGQKAARIQLSFKKVVGIIEQEGDLTVPELKILAQKTKNLLGKIGIRSKITDDGIQVVIKRGTENSLERWAEVIGTIGVKDTPGKIIFDPRIERFAAKFDQASGNVYIGIRAILEPEKAWKILDQIVVHEGAEHLAEFRKLSMAGQIMTKEDLINHISYHAKLTGEVEKIPKAYTRRLGNGEFIGEFIGNEPPAFFRQGVYRTNNLKSYSDFLENGLSPNTPFTGCYDDVLRDLQEELRAITGTFVRPSEIVDIIQKLSRAQIKSLTRNLNYFDDFVTRQAIIEVGSFYWPPQDHTFRAVVSQLDDQTKIGLFTDIYGDRKFAVLLLDTPEDAVSYIIPSEIKIGNQVVETGAVTQVERIMEAGAVSAEDAEIINSLITNFVKPQAETAITMARRSLTASEIMKAGAISAQTTLYNGFRDGGRQTIEFKNTLRGNLKDLAELNNRLQILRDVSKTSYLDLWNRASWRELPTLQEIIESLPQTCTQ